MAYQTVGDGPADLAFISDWAGTMEAMWDFPALATFGRELASFTRLICFDKRGQGISDPPPPRTGLEVSVDDTLTVLEAVGSKRAIILGDGQAGAVAMMFAATYPQRTSALILVNSYARFLRDETTPWGLPPDRLPRLLLGFEHYFGTPEMLDVLAPDEGEEFRQQFAHYQRLGMSPMQAVEGYGEYLMRVDVGSILSSINVPTLVLHRAGNTYVRVEHGRHLAQAIPGATYRELPGTAHVSFAGDSQAILSEIRGFVSGVRDDTSITSRALATVMFTDIVGSSEHAGRLGDTRWREVLEAHNALVRGQIARYRGRAIKTTGDGFLATFDGPARAIQCARDIATAVRDVGIEIRAGLHAGEIEIVGEDVAGIAVHVAARAMAEAGPGEVVVSSTVKDLVAGSSLQFGDRGEHALKGVGSWRLYTSV